MFVNCSFTKKPLLKKWKHERHKVVEMYAEKVMVLDDLSSAYEWNIPRAKNIVFVKGSVLDEEKLKNVKRFVYRTSLHGR